MIYEDGFLRAGQPAMAETPTSPFLDIASSMPGMVGVAGLTAFRTTNTMLHGPRETRVRDRITQTQRKTTLDATGPEGRFGGKERRKSWVFGNDNEYSGAPKTGRTWLRGTDHRNSISLGMKNWTSLAWNPRAWTRMASDEYLINGKTFLDGRRTPGVTTPFQAAGLFNTAMNKAYGGKRAQANLASGKGKWGQDNWRRQVAMDAQNGKKTTFWQGGTMSRLAASAKIDNMSDAAFDAMKASPSRWMQKQSHGIFTDGFRSKEEASRAIRMQTGGLGGAAGGFVQGIQDFDQYGPGLASTPHRTGGARGVELDKSSTTAANYGRQKGLNWSDDIAKHGAAKAAGTKFGKKQLATMAGKKIAVRGAVYANAWNPIVAPAATLLAAYDIATMATKVVGYGAKTYADGYKSFASGMNSSVGGGGFVDNEVTLSQRARAVSEIQNSRLNARSALGNEGSAMAGYFS